MMVAMNIIVNGLSYETEAGPSETLLDLLRDRLGLIGTKRGCEKGDCGACTVIMDGDAGGSCLVPALQADGAQVLTI